MKHRILILFVLLLAGFGLAGCDEPPVEADAPARWLVQCYSQNGDIVFEQKFQDVEVGDTGIFIKNKAGQSSRLDGNCRAIVLGKAAKP